MGKREGERGGERGGREGETGERERGRQRGEMCFCTIIYLYIVSCMLLIRNHMIFSCNLE